MLLLGDLIALTLDLAPVLEQRIAGLITPELENQIARRQDQERRRTDKQLFPAAHPRCEASSIVPSLSQLAPRKAGTDFIERRSARPAGPLPAARPPSRRRGRAALREGQRPELGQRLHVDQAFEVDDLLDRAPVVDPAAAVELGLLRQIEAKPARVAIELQQEPALLLPDADWRALAADIFRRQPVAKPVARLADQLDVVPSEPDLLVQLSVHRRLGALVGLDAALRELPAAAAASAGDQDAPLAVHQDDSDVSPETLFVDEVHGSGPPIAARPRSAAEVLNRMIILAAVRQNDPVPAAGLRLVQRRVGARDQPRPRVAVAGGLGLKVRDADRHGHGQRLPPPAEVERPIRDHGADPLREHGARPGVGAGQQDHELLAAVPGGDIAAADLVADPPGDAAQDVVADEVAVTIVDRLEMIDVDHQARERRALAAAPRDLLVQPRLEVAPVAPAGQRVGQAALHEAGPV